MAIFECKYRLGLTDIGRSNTMTNKAILKVLENSGGMQSEQIGYGLNEIEKTNLSWVLLSWKVKVIKRPIYNTELTVKTWSKDCNRAFTYRDYEIYDAEGNIVIIASSKWTLIDIVTKKLAPLSEELIRAYEPEEKSVFMDRNIAKLKEPLKYESEVEYKVKRVNIDINDHVHNLYYLDFAYEALPEKVYRSSECNNIEIMYKKQTKLNDEIVCLYSREENKNIIAVKSKDKKVLHAIISLY